MTDRRAFLRKSLLVTGAAFIGRPGIALASPGTFPPGVIYTRERPGRWAGKEGGHAPKVDVGGKSVTITTSHPMTDAHYIVRHTLVDGSGTVLGERTFSPSDQAATSTYEISLTGGGIFYATSFCNLHDFWLTPFTV